MHPGDGLHHAAVAHQQPVAIDVLDAPRVRVAKACNRHRRLAAYDARHRRRPQQLLAQVRIDELVQVAQVLQQFLVVVEGRRDQLGQRFRIVGGDVRIGQRRAQRARVRRLRDVAIGRDPQRFALQAAPAARDQPLLAAVHQRSQAPLIHAIDHDTRHHPSRFSGQRPSSAHRPPADAAAEAHLACPASEAAMHGPMPGCHE